MIKAQLRAGKTPGLKEMIAHGYQTQGLKEEGQLKAIRLKVQKKWIAQGYEAQSLEGTDKEDQLESGYEINGLKSV